MKFTSRLPAVAVATIALAACVQVYPPQGAPEPAEEAGAAADAEPKPSEDESKSPFKPYDKVLEKARAVDGYFKFHIKRDGKLLLELEPDRLDADFGLVMHYSRGLGDLDIQEGLPLTGEARLMRFQRVGDRVYLVHRNPRFVADTGSAMRLSMEDNVGHSVVAAFDIESQHEENGNLVLDVTEFFVSDYGASADWLEFWYGRGAVGFDKGRSHIGKVGGFPNNVEIDAELTYKSSEPPRFGGEGVSDPKSIPIGVRYSLFELPDPPMTPRLADDRVGHFITAVKDFSRDQRESSYVRYVDRWRLEKSDPTAEISEPVEPIVFYIDRSVPEDYREYVRQGVEAWNKAFERAGFRNAIVARTPPENDSTWSAEDIRYSTVRWTAAHRMGYATGPHQTDPRTGEILNADILISSEFVRSWLFDWQELASPTAMIRRLIESQERLQNLPGARAARACHAQAGAAHQLALQYTLLAGLGRLGPGDVMPDEYLGDAIRDLVMHEVGHTLGLRHNFKGSSGVPHQRLNDTTFTRRNGLTLSVMDYSAVNVSPDPTEQGHYWNKEVGAYDVWAIRYAYTPVGAPRGTNGGHSRSPEAELAPLRAIAEEAADPLHTYGTDEDNWLGPFAVDPLTNAWDLSSDPVRHARDRAALVARVQPELESRLIDEGEGYQRLRGAVSSLIFERFITLLPVTKMVGGLYFARDHKGDPNARPPFTPVAAAEQREAVRVLVDQAFAENAFELEPDLLNRLAPSRYSHWGVGDFRVPLDFPIHSHVQFIQGVLLDQLLNPIRLARMIDNEVRAPAGADVYGLDRLFRQLSDAIWAELGDGRGRARSVTSFRRNLQRMYTDKLIGMMVSPSAATPEDARSLARLHLEEAAERIDTAAAGSRSLDEATRAHLEETRVRIARALDAELSISAGRRGG